MSTNGDSAPGAAYRLPRSVVPNHYALVLEPDLEQATFAGSSRIDVEVCEPVDEIVVNAAELEIDAAAVVRKHKVTELEITLDAERERAHLHLPAPLEAGAAEIQLHFRGRLNDQLRGFYRSVYTDEDGQQHTLATTQLESTDARRAFPCWDEPDLKATFDVTLVVDDGLAAVSNSPEVESTTLADGRRRVRFARTMKMSTYLVAFVVGRLEATAPRKAGDTPIRVVAPPGRLHLADFALDCAEFCLGWFEHYYGIPYPGLKVDLIAIPDFAAGAMENLGAITFRENALLVDPEAATRAELERVADVVAHELAHMWFGDLVTMKWWNGIWLNEAFATFMELSAIDAMRPEWDRWATQRADSAGALEIDALPTTRAVEFPVHAPADAEGMFDVLTYYKGASVLRMLEQYLGEDRFRAGVRAYLERHAYGNTETGDLWDALEAVTGEPCRRLMDSWIYTGGFPSVTVSRGDSPRRITIRQRPARLGEDPDPSRRWLVPIIIRAHHADGPAEHRVLLEDDSVTLEVDRDVEAVVANAGGHGFYRVTYETELLEAAADRIADMTTIERLALVSDVWASVLAGETDASTFVELAARFGGERSHQVWNALSGVDGSPTSGMHGMWELVRVLDPPDRPVLQQRIVELTEPATAALGWEIHTDDTEGDRLTRGVVLRTRGVLGADVPTVDQAGGVLKEAIDDPHGFDPEVRAAAVRIVAAHATDEDRAMFLDLYRQAATPQDEMRFLHALADTPHADQARATAELCFTDEVRTQNAPLVLRRLIGSLHLPVSDEGWHAVASRWDEVTERFPRNLVPRMLEGIRARSTPERASEVEAFLADHPIPQAGATLDQLLDRLRANVALRQRAAPELARHLGG